MPQWRHGAGVATGSMHKFANRPEKVPIANALFASEPAPNKIDQHNKLTDLRLS